jgi:hypothetical protein
MYIGKPNKTKMNQLTIFPKFVFFLSPERESLSSLLQGLEQDRLRNLEGRIVGLPKLEVDRRKHVARYRRVPETNKVNLKVKSIPINVRSLFNIFT